MGASGALFHFSLLGAYMFTLYTLGQENPVAKQHAALKNFGRFSARFLTNWTFMTQTLYLFLSVLGHLLAAVSLSSLKRPIDNLADYIFMSIATPMALVVSIAFWSIYAVDRELVFPTVLDLVIPAWVNQMIHSINSVAAIVDLVSIRHKQPSWSASLTGLILYLLAYSVCLFGTYVQTGIWLYPVLKEMSWPLRGAFTIANLLLAILMLALTRLLRTSIWGKSDTQEKKKAVKPKKK
ncbi:FAR-17a/AIG1-like protein [Nesidiocoris tenuis]|uniref:FAR-17a/AIG1-like protein n=1 Tax=Nesidiocoris tenuis TaxID=355587 RepID=A0ABN7A673_9HEMI|nr:FAR-17a/AIG1-like protein [Nesidiocoris tenuis]